MRGNFVECGKIGRPWGVKGQFLVYWNSGTCPVKVGRGTVYSRNQDGDYVPHLVLSSRQNGNRCVVSLKGIEDPKDAAALTHEILYIPESELPKLPNGEFYSYQILGLTVETENGEELGKIANIFSTGSNDVYEVKPKKGETILIPAIKNVIVKIDIEKRRMIIKPMEGMLD